jgi:MFS family permease
MSILLTRRHRHRKRLFSRTAFKEQHRMSRPGFFSRDRIVAPPEFDRRWIPPASIAIHLCIGAAYAWSIFNPALMRIQGVVVPAAGDWKLSEVTRTFTIAIVFLGLSAAVAGKWLERVGPRTVGILAAVLWSGGYLIGALGISLHSLALLYLGYGVVGGCGLGLGYVSPVSTLIKWFPDRRGMAAGMAIMGFGGGAILATPLQGKRARPPVLQGWLCCQGVEDRSNLVNGDGHGTPAECGEVGVVAATVAGV